MPHDDAPHLLGLIVFMLVAARLLGALARRAGQPPVLGELAAGVLLGRSALGWVDSTQPVLDFLGEVGVVLLLFEIGRETHLSAILRVGGSALAVALVGVILPLALGYGVARILGLTHLQSVVVGAALTATSIGITARVFADLGRLRDPEAQVVLGAAVIDDVVGLIILAIVAGAAEGKSMGFLQAMRLAATAFGFLAATLVVGRFAIPPLVRAATRAGPLFTGLLKISLALGLAWLAAQVGSAVIVGAFSAGLLLPHPAEEEERNSLADFFVPLFFVMVGASVNLRAFNPLEPADRSALVLVGLLSVAAVLGKLLAGYAAFWFPGRKAVVGVGMVPRGEVGLIFARMGLSTAVFGPVLFSAVALVVMITTFVAPPWLKWLMHRPRGKLRA